MWKDEISEAKLPGCEGPFFGTAIRNLNETWYSEKYRSRNIWRHLVEVSRLIKGYRGIYTEITTTDGFKWCRSVHFRTAKGIVLILFPWKHYFSYRSIAVYTGGKVELSQLQDLITELNNKMIESLNKIAIGFFEINISDLTRH